jgi:hypothetical protein
MIIHVTGREIESILEDDFGREDTENGMGKIVAEVKVLDIGNNLGYVVIFETAAGNLKVCLISIDIRGVPIDVSGSWRSA